MYRARTHSLVHSRTSARASDSILQCAAATRRAGLKETARNRSAAGEITIHEWLQFWDRTSLVLSEAQLRRAELSILNSNVAAYPRGSRSR